MPVAGKSKMHSASSTVDTASNTVQSEYILLSILCACCEVKRIKMVCIEEERQNQSRSCRSGRCALPTGKHLLNSSILWNWWQMLSAAVAACSFPIMLKGTLHMLLAIRRTASTNIEIGASHQKVSPFNFKPQIYIEHRRCHWLNKQ